MKKLYTIILLAFIGLSFKANAQIVNIPDANFKAALITNGVHDSAGYITVDTARAFTGALVMENYNISDLKGIEAFTSITSLYCARNKLISLDVTANTALTFLDCGSNYLGSLYVMTDTALTYLDCRSNYLTGLDVAYNTALTVLHCNNNQLTSLNLSYNTVLATLNCESNRLTSLNLSSNTALFVLTCYLNQLTSLNLSCNSSLTSLVCFNNQLTSLNLSSYTALSYLYSSNNQLADLNLSSDTALKYLDCSFNNLTSLNLSSNSALTVLYCSYNNLTNLNVKNGNNHNISNSNFKTFSNYYLSCIQVDDTAYAKANWTQIDLGTHFSTDCSPLSISEIKAITDVNIYPNPFTSAFEIKTQGVKAVSINIYGVLGQLIYNRNLTDNKVSIDMNAAPAGIYLMQITDAEKNIINRKIIKQ